MSFEISGKLHKKYDTEQKTSSFQAREFVIIIDETSNYPQFIKFQLTQDRCGQLDPFEEGKQIKVHFDLRGREWQGKYFTNLNAWRLESVEAGSEDPGPQEPPFGIDEPDSGQDEGFEDLPF
jgi:hypothetical protein